MSELLKHLKRRSKLRRRMIAHLWGFSNVQQLRQALNFPMRKRAHKRLTHKDKKCIRPNSSKHNDADEDLHKNSSPFSVHNDYCQHFVDTGQRPQNFIREGTRSNRFQEYPKQKELVRLKDELLEQTSISPMFLKCNLNTFDLNSLNIKFDVLLVIPPLEEYQQKLGVTNTIYWNWEQVIELNLNEIAANRSFIFLWCGSSDGVDKGRDCLRRWGFRRCEDICWVKTNCKNLVNSKIAEPNALFQHTKEHCLMGVKGTVHRSTHSDFIHANIDTDIIISEEKEFGSLEKPDEIFNIIEHFCLGKRRLHLFGLDSTVRPGWLTLGHELTSSNFNMELYKEYFNNGQLTTGCTYLIEKLRPKSPTNNVYNNK